jgi:hypothetical protein
MLSVHEPTWDKQKRMHTCCGSHHSYHKGHCPVKGVRIPGRASDPEFMKVQEAKSEGLTSGDVAKKLNMPLEQVNELWIE